MDQRPRIFLSYAWENDDYREWVARLATSLRNHGLDARLDRWHLRGTTTIAQFMASEVRKADKILMLCSPAYKRKIEEMEDGGKPTGSGWEAMLISAGAFQAGEQKHVPVLARGEWHEAAPLFVRDVARFDLRPTNPEAETQFQRLLERLFEQDELAPPIGAPPRFESKQVEPLFPGPHAAANAPASLPQSQERVIALQQALTAEDAPLWCLVLVSDKVGEGSRLPNTVNAALRIHWDRIGGESHKPAKHFLTASDALASRDAFLTTVQALCRSEFVVFDMTDYEPAMMMLIGIRSVVRRGVNLVTVDHELPAHEWVKIPFSLKQISPIEHVPRPDYHPKNPNRLIGEALAEGWRQLHSLPNYLDLPSYDDVRLLGSHKEDYETVPWHKSILWMCSFDAQYLDRKGSENGTSGNYANASTSVGGAFRELAAERKLLRGSSPVHVKLIIDIASPRLMSQRTYAAIRRHELCVVDWTQWRPNVFYEFGVRLAVSGIDPLCLLDADHAPAPAGHIGTPEQRQRLIALFKPMPYSGAAITQDSVSECCRHWLNRDLGGTLDFGDAYAAITASIDIDREPPSRAVHEELVATADALAGADRERAGSLPILYDDLEALSARAEHGAWSRRAVAWQVLDGRIRPNGTLAENVAASELDAFEELSSQLLRRSETDEDFLGADQKQRIEGALATLTSGRSVSDATLLKERARGLRKRSEVDAARAALRKAIGLLEKAVEAGPRAEPNARAAAELADVHGMLASTFLGANELEDACREYDRGAVYENDARFGIESTYNGLNRLIARLLLAPGALEDPAALDAHTDLESVNLEDEFRQIARRIEAQTQGARARDAWAAGDLFLVTSLIGDQSWADDAWSRLKQLPSDPFVFDAYFRTVDRLICKGVGRPELEEAKQRLAVASADARD